VTLVRHFSLIIGVLRGTRVPSEYPIHSVKMINR
jgi:hypothetical protein